MSTAVNGELVDQDRRRSEIVRLYLRGHNQRQVAEILGISTATVSIHINRAHAEWKTERLNVLDEARDREAQRLYAAMIEAWDAWERSKRPARTTKAKIVKGALAADGVQPEPDRVTTEQQDKQRDGDARFLEMYIECGRDLRAMYGLDTPKQMQLTGANGGPITLATLLTMVQERPPAPPLKFDLLPSNVIDVESIERLIADPRFEPRELQETPTEQAVEAPTANAPNDQRRQLASFEDDCDESTYGE